MKKRAYGVGVLIFGIIIMLLPTVAKGVWLDIMPSSGTKCVSEDLHLNTLVLTDYYIISDDEQFSKANVFPTMSIRVTSPFGYNLHHQENVTHGQFAFTATEAGNYLACFWMVSGHEVGKATVGIDWKTGFAAKDWESVAKREKIEGVELELRKLEGAVQAIHENLLYLKSRESDMRGVSERTNARVAWLSLMSLGVCIVVSVIQVWYLKSYFQKKKLI